MAGLRSFLKNELFYWFLSNSGILILIVVYGILFDTWYKNWEIILIAGTTLYLITVLFRFFSWIGRKASGNRKKNGI